MINTRIATRQVTAGTTLGKTPVKVGGINEQPEIKPSAQYGNWDDLRNKGGVGDFMLNTYKDGDYSVIYNIDGGWVEKKITRQEWLDLQNYNGTYGGY